MDCAHSGDDVIRAYGCGGPFLNGTLRPALPIVVLNRRSCNRMTMSQKGYALALSQMTNN
jgi:hypothetical protein